MKKINLTIVLIGVFSLGISNFALADSDAKRKNKCKNNKFFKASAKTKGGTSNCGNLNTGFDWTCSENITGASNPANGNITSIMQRHNSTAGACTCGDPSNTNLLKAAEASATSRSNMLASTSSVYQFGCAWPNKWKAGTYSNYQNFKTSSPMLISPNQNNNYISSVAISSSDLRFDYNRSEIVLNNINAAIKKFTPDMINDYATFVINVSLVIGEDAARNEIERSLYNCKVTIYNDKLLVEDISNSFTTSDFTEMNVGTDGKEFKLNTTSKTLKLNEVINENSELNVTFSTDCGNYENGASGRFIMNENITKSEDENIKDNQDVKLDLLNNPVLGDDIIFKAAIKTDDDITPTKFTVLNMDGTSVKEIVIPISENYLTYKIGAEGLNNGIYLLTLSYKNKVYARKFIIDNND